MVLEKLQRMARIRPRPEVRQDRITRTEEPGASPGTLTVEPDSPPPQLTVMAYGPEHFVERRLDDVEGLTRILEQWPMTWLDVDGLGDPALIERLGTMFHIHHLTLEDIVHVDQRIKVEVFPTYLFLVVRMAYLHGSHLESEQLSIIVGDGFVLTFQEGRPGDCLDPVRRRIREGLGHLRKRGAAYLAYALMDAVTDHYFPLLSQLGDHLDVLEDQVLTHPPDDIVSRINDTKRTLSLLYRMLSPKRDAIATLRRETTPLVDDDVRLHLGDVADHAAQVVDLLVSYREIAAGLIDMHLSLAGHRMNEIMKVLTVIGSVFIPLTFIAGVYGMNFDPGASPYNMPELAHPYGYVLTMLAMAGVTIGMLVFFARRGWIGGSRWR